MKFEVARVWCKNRYLWSPSLEGLKGRKKCQDRLHFLLEFLQWHHTAYVRLKQTTQHGSQDLLDWPAPREPYQTTTLPQCSFSQPSSSAPVVLSIYHPRHIFSLVLFLLHGISFMSFLHTTTTYSPLQIQCKSTLLDEVPPHTGQNGHH